MDIHIMGPEPISKKVGTVATVDMETGEVLDVKRNAFNIAPPAPDVCQICAVDHTRDQPHNQMSLYYQFTFHAEHGRYPRWSDAMAHCTPEVQDYWRQELVKVIKSHGLKVPEDLRDEHRREKVTR